MTVMLEGVVKGRQIRLTHKTGLPEGAFVRVRVQTQTKSRREKLSLLQKLFGSCANDPTFARAVANRERQRRTLLPRKVRFDVAS